MFSDEKDATKDMTKEMLHIGGRECIRYATSTEAETLLVQPVDEHDLEEMDKELDVISKLTGQQFQWVAVKIVDWQSELTPWATPPVFGKVPFGDQAANTLHFITTELLPTMPTSQVLLGGYSLAGLFALWASYNSNMFDGIAAASPSVWYPQWIDYAKTHTPLSHSIYLSLGNKEERARNPIMARVGNCIREQYELLKAQNVQTQLEWNEGNHFVDAGIRMAKGFAWLMNQKKISRSLSLENG